MLPADHPETLRLFDAELDLVSIITRQTLRAFGGRFVEADELMSYGREGLLQAARTFQADRGVPFRRWANVKVRGAIYDGIRKTARLPRRLYARMQALSAANHLTEASDDKENGQTGAETQEEADAKISERLQESATVMAAAMLAARSMDDEAYRVADQEQLDPEEASAAKQVAIRLRAAVESREDPEKTLLLRMYWHGETLEEAGALVGLSRSWACRVHARAVASLARALKPDLE